MGCSHAQYIDKQATDSNGNKLDAYEIEAAAERDDTMRDLAEFNLASVSVLARL